MAPLQVPLIWPTGYLNWTRGISTLLKKMTTENRDSVCSQLTITNRLAAVQQGKPICNISTISSYTNNTFYPDVWCISMMADNVSKSDSNIESLTLSIWHWLPKIESLALSLWHGHDNWMVTDICKMLAEVSQDILQLILERMLNDDDAYRMQWLISSLQRDVTQRATTTPKTAPSSSA